LKQPLIFSVRRPLARLRNGNKKALKSISPGKSVISGLQKKWMGGNLLERKLHISQAKRKLILKKQS
jgi:hypothetical protein